MFLKMNTRSGGYEQYEETECIVFYVTRRLSELSLSLTEGIKFLETN